MAMTFDGQDQAARAKRSVQIGQCAKEGVSSNLIAIGKLAPPCLCYKHIPSY